MKFGLCFFYMKKECIFIQLIDTKLKIRVRKLIIICTKTYFEFNMSIVRLVIFYNDILFNNVKYCLSVILIENSLYLIEGNYNSILLFA